ncbi:unnamed protein product [Urochloa humidicola]
MKHARNICNSCQEKKQHFEGGGIRERRQRLLRLGAEAECSRNATLCADRDRFLFFDRVHPSQRAVMLGAQAYCDGPAQFTTPITFKQLAQKS